MYEVCIYFYYRYVIAGRKAIVVAPGRELASQIFSVCERLTEGLGLRSAMVIGGANALRQVDRLKKVKPQVRQCFFFFFLYTDNRRRSRSREQVQYQHAKNSVGKLVICTL